MCFFVKRILQRALFLGAFVLLLCEIRLGVVAVHHGGFAGIFTR